VSFEVLGMMQRREGERKGLDLYSHEARKKMDPLFPMIGAWSAAVQSGVWGKEDAEGLSWT